MQISILYNHLGLSEPYTEFQKSARSTKDLLMNPQVEISIW